MPASWTDRARAILDGDLVPAEPRRAATVVLLRERPGGPEAYLLRRHAGMKFAAGMYAFPGGGVDPRDADHAVAWAGPSPEEWAERFGTSAAEARAIVAAAVRETFEESGVLLAGPGPDSVVADTTGDDWETERAALVDRSLGFTEFLDRRGLVLRSDLLKAWGHWITPVMETRRFDTRFFVAALPSGQRTRDVGGEASEVAWMRPGDALAAAREHTAFLMPPTFRTLTEMAAFETIGDVLSCSRSITTIVPAPAEVDGRMVLVIPEEIPEEIPVEISEAGRAGA